MQLSYEKKSPYFWRCSSLAGQNELGWAEYSCSIGLKRVAVMVPDFSYGHDMLKFFKKDFRNHGGEVIQSIIVPFPTTDFAPYLSTVIPKGAGAPLPTFRQLRLFGLLSNSRHMTCGRRCP